MINSGTPKESELTDGNPIPIVLWGALFLFAGSYYLWTWYFSEARAARSGRTSTDRGLGMQQVRLKQQERLRAESAMATAEKKVGGDMAPDPSAVVVEKTQRRSAAPRQRATAYGEDAAAKKALKEKRRKMYLQHKKEKEKEEEKQKKMEEMGPGWQRHEGGSAMGYNAMDPNTSSSSGGYRAPNRCVRRGG